MVAATVRRAPPGGEAGDVRRVAGLIIGVVASVVLAAPAQGAVECGTTITQDRKLKADLVDCPSDAIAIDGDDITLDLNGHKIDGTGATGVFVVAGSDNATVKDGVIRDTTSWAVFAEDVVDLRVANLTVINPGAGGLAVQDALGVAIEDLAVRRAAFTAVNFHTVNEGEVSEAVVEENDEAGFILTNVSDMSFSDIAALGTDTGGFTGITLADSSADNRFADLELTDWGFAGFYTNTTQSGNKITRAIARRNEYGFSLAGTGGIAVRRSKALRSGDDGLLVGDTADVRVTKSRFNRNVDEGIEFLDGATGAVGNNVANDNGDFGITIPLGGVTDLGGNRARGNGGAVQCVNVSC